HVVKFDGKADEGFFVRYSLNTKAFRVFNIRTRILGENLRIRFSKNTHNIAKSGLNWLSYIDAQTKSTNYKLDVVGNQSNGNAESKNSQNDGFQPSSADGKKVDEDPRQESKCKDQEKEDNVNITNNVNVVGTNGDNVVGANTNIKLPFDPEMPALEDISTFNFLSDHEDVDEEADMNNMNTTIQMNVKSAILYGKIKEEVYVCQPPGFEDPDFPNKVYKVVKALYELHQDPRAWYKTLSTYLLDNGYHKGKIDKTLFIRRHKGDILHVQVYVDDIIFGSTKKELCNAFEKMMHEKFQMRSMGKLTFFLGLQVKQNQDGIFISQDKYVAEILKKYGFLEVKNASTPMETQKPVLMDEDREEVDVHMYRSMIGSLMYLTSSRLDIMIAVCAYPRYEVNLKVSHLHVVKMIFRYLKGQPKFDLWYPKDSPFDLVTYTDSDYATASLDRKSTIGDETVNKEMNDTLERAVTTATSLDTEQDRARVESSEDEGLSKEDASKQGRIVDIDANKDITVVSTHDEQMFYTDQDLELKHTKPKAKAKGNVFHEPEESTTTTTAARPKPKSQNKGKAKMIKEPVKLKKKDQIQLDEEVALKDNTRRSSKRAGDELEQERYKKQKVEDDKESEEIKKCFEIIPEDGDNVTIDATPLSSKSPTIVDYKIYKEG
nr:uncharacterized mitochondrial protein AtMg00810-like [Tanacetum cinerariifolium]